MIFLLPLLLIPLALVGLLEPYWQRRALAGVVAIYLTWVVVKIAGASRLRTGKTQTKGHSWPKDQTASEFQVSFIAYVTAAGCHVTWSKIADPARVGFAIQKGKRLAVVLCVAPATAVREGDAIVLDHWRRAQGAAGSAIIAAARGAEPGGHAMSYGDLRGRDWFEGMF